MSVTTDYAPVREAGTGAKVDYGATFPVILATDLTVGKILNSTGVKTDMVYGVDYTVTINASTRVPTVHYTVAPTVLQDSWIGRNVPATQTEKIPTNNVFRETQLNNALDKTMMVLQQIKEAVVRCVKLPDTSTGITPVLPTPEDGKAIVWDGVLGAMKNVAIDVASLAASVAAAAASAATATAQAGVATAQAVIATAQAVLAAGYASAANLSAIAAAASAAAFTKATGAEINTGTDDEKFVTPKAIADSQLVKGGTLPAFLVRAWVQFTGTSGAGDQTINGSGNVASVVQGTVGECTVTFTTPMPDTNYAVLVSSNNGVSDSGNADYCITRNVGSCVVKHFEAGTLRKFNVGSVIVIR